jgi:transposase-like protein
MSQPTTKKYSAEFKERAVKLAVESEQPIAQTARDLGVNENTLHTWIGKYHRAERQEPQVHDGVPGATAGKCTVVPVAQNRCLLHRPQRSAATNPLGTNTPHRASLDHPLDAP